MAQHDAPLVSQRFAQLAPDVQVAAEGSSLVLRATRPPDDVLVSAILRRNQLQCLTIAGDQSPVEARSPDLATHVQLRDYDGFVRARPSLQQVVEEPPLRPLARHEGRGYVCEELCYALVLDARGALSRPHVASATAVYRLDYWGVEAEFDDEDAKRLEALLCAGAGQRDLAILWDGMVVSMPPIKECIPNIRRVLITIGGGEDPKWEAEVMAASLLSGPLQCRWMTNDAGPVPQRKSAAEP